MLWLKVLKIWFYAICKTWGRIRMRTGIVLMAIRIRIWIGINIEIRIRNTDKTNNNFPFSTDEASESNYEPGVTRPPAVLIPLNMTLIQRKRVSWIRCLSSWPRIGGKKQGPRQEKQEQWTEQNYVTILGTVRIQQHRVHCTLHLVLYPLTVRTHCFRVESGDVFQKTVW